MRGALAALAVVLAVTGCVQVPGSSGCSFAGQPCTPDGDGWIVEAMDVQGDAQLHLSTGSHVVLRDVTIRGADHVGLYVSCQCAIQGDGFEIEGAGLGAVVWLYGDPDHTRDVVLDGIRVQGSNRFGVQNVGGSLTISNTTLHCHDSPWAIELDHIPATTSFMLADIMADGCGGVSLGARDMSEPVPLHILRSSFSGAYPKVVHDGISGTAGSLLAITLEGSTISDVRYALNLGEGDSLQMHDSTIKDADTGISMSKGSTASVEGGTFEGNVYAIRGWDEAMVKVSDSRFIGNGGSLWEAPCSAAIGGSLRGWVHASLFEGNQVAVDVYPMGFDATDNYWGLPSGPAPITGCTVRQAAAQQVASGVMYVPFRTTPP